jgi:glutamate-ammonia-ligase adenylyltransferase
VGADRRDPAAGAIEDLQSFEGGEHAVSLALNSADPGMALRNLVQFARAIGSLPEPLEAAVRLFAGSQSMSVAAVREPALLTEVLADPGIPDAATLNRRCRRRTANGEGDPRGSLRRFVRQESLRVLLADLTGTLGLEEVAAAISRIADAAVDHALSLATAELVANHGTPRDDEGNAATITVIGLGKLGGGELNYSSDIDLLFLYSEDGRTDSADPDRVISNRDLFTLVVERTRRLLADRTPEGHCYRVDLRLRPEGSTGVLTRSVRSALDYYRRTGRTWERQALIKARPIAGDLELGEREFIDGIADFVYGTPLTIENILSIKKLKREIERRSGGARQV